MSLLLVPQRALAYRGPEHLSMYRLTEPFNDPTTSAYPHPQLVGGGVMQRVLHCTASKRQSQERSPGLAPLSSAAPLDSYVLESTSDFSSSKSDTLLPLYVYCCPGHRT